MTEAKLPCPPLPGPDRRPLQPARVLSGLETLSPIHPAFKGPLSEPGTPSQLWPRKTHSGLLFRRRPARRRAAQLPGQVPLAGVAPGPPAPVDAWGGPPGDSGCLGRGEASPGRGWSLSLGCGPHSPQPLPNHTPSMSLTVFLLGLEGFLPRQILSVAAKGPPEPGSYRELSSW